VTDRARGVVAIVAAIALGVAFNIVVLGLVLGWLAGKVLL
jgi:hypothetical protein